MNAKAFLSSSQLLQKNQLPSSQKDSSLLVKQICLNPKVQTPGLRSGGLLSHPRSHGTLEHQAGTSAGRLSLQKLCLAVWAQMIDWENSAVILIKETFSHKKTHCCKKLQEGLFAKLICREIRNCGLTKLSFRQTRKHFWGGRQDAGYSDHQSSIQNAQFQIRKHSVIKVSLMLMHILTRNQKWK